MRWFGRGLLLAMALCTGAASWAQSSPSFEVATVRASDPNETRGRLGIEQDRFVTGNQTLKDLLQFAYGLNSGERRVFGGPDWVETAKFDINAKIDAAMMEQLPKMPPEQAIGLVRGMVQRLLAERFALKVHHESRELPVYRLEVAKGGTKLKASGGEVKREERGLTSTGGHVEGRHAKVGMLADLLGFQMETGGRQVLDKTGLTGEYDFSLQWTKPGPDGVVPADAPSPGLFTALQEQLGLRMELTKASVDVIVIDRAEMPAGN